MDKLKVLEYKELEEFLIEKLNEMQRGSLRNWCNEHSLPLSEVSRFKNRNLNEARPIFIKDLLEAFGYKNVKI